MQIAQQVTRIVPTTGWVAPRIAQIWKNRELLMFLMWRELTVRYKVTWLGVSWAVLQPFITMLIFSLFLGRLVKLPSDGIPYPAFCFCALVPWFFFSNGLQQSSNSVISYSHIITKVYFPRLLLPISTVLCGIAEICLSLIVLIGMLCFFNIPFTLQILYLPLYIFLACTTTLGVGLWLSTLNVMFRDINFITPFLIQLWFFSTPIVYPSSILPNTFWQNLYALNPLVGVIEGFRWSVFGLSNPTIVTTTAISFVVSMALLFTGWMMFRRIENRFVELF